VIAHGARDEHRVAHGHPGRGQLPTGRNQADAGRRDVHPVGGAAVDDLGVARHDRNAGGGGSFRHVGHDLAQLVDGEPLLQHESGGEGDRSGPHHGEVVDGAVHGEVPRRPARKAQRLDHVGVGAESQPLTRGQDEDRCIGLRLGGLCGERREEDGIEQRGRRLPAGAVGQGDHVVEEARPAAAEGLDPLEHDGLTVRGPRFPRRVGHDATSTARWRCTLDHSSSSKAS
jgi:hypothetical protein